MEDRSPSRAEAGCSDCKANGSGRCAPFASAGRDKCAQFPECCNWCRVLWCPNNRAKELYTSLRSGEQVPGQVP